VSTGPLSETYTTVLNASGNGSVSFGPNRQRQKWTPPLTVAVATSSAVKIPAAILTMGAQQLGSTYTGSGDADDLPAVTVLPGQKLTVTWTGGDVGAVASASIAGTVEIY
jgi:hypothetical protein